MCSDAVRRGHPVVVAVAPVAADASRRLEAVEVDPARVQHLRRGDAGRAGADDADGGSRRHAAAEDDASASSYAARMRADGDDPDSADVKAARRAWSAARRRRRVVVVHRPRYDDWSFPKGKLDPGESWEEAALREVEEEIGLRCRLGAELPPSTTATREGPQGRALLADGAESGEFAPNEEVDEMRWLTPAEAERAAQLRPRSRPRCARPAREPRALPRAARRLGAARRAGRHADGRQRDRRDGRVHALGPQRQPRRRVRRRRGDRRARRDDARQPSRRCSAPTRGASSFGPSMTALTMRFAAAVGRDAAARATRSSARASTTTPTSARG